MAGRKEYELLFKLQAALGGNFNTVFQSALNTTKQMQNSLTKLNSITGKIDAYKKQEAALESNRQKLERLTAEHDKLQREMSETAAPSEELRQKMAKNEKQIAATTAKIEAQEQRLQTLGSELSDVGVNTATCSLHGHPMFRDGGLCNPDPKIRKLAANLSPSPMTAGPDDMAVMPYTSGTTGHPKGCVHTHRSVMYNTIARHVWLKSSADTVMLAVLPFFHVTGMQNALNGAIYLGATAIVIPRWDRDVALQCIGRYKVTAAQLISTMVVDMLSHPNLDAFDLSSLNSVGGGGAAMPEAIAQKLKNLVGADYIEGYGMSETMAATHINPTQRPMKQCLGIPIFDVDARVVDPSTFAELPAGEIGEIIVHGPQVMREYWRAPDANRDSFVEIDGKRFLRTGDLAYADEHGYFFMVDRLKRMINASGFKVWPAEVEAMLYHHPAIQEACVIAAQDPRRGETVKAVVVLKPDHVGTVTEQEIVEWAHDHMAAYKSPRIVTIVDHLPKSASGKIQWRELQDRELSPPSAAQA